MNRVCCVDNCASRGTGNDDVSFHKFPLYQPELLKQWVSSTHRKDWQPTETSFICSVHFSADSFVDKKNKVLKEDAVPILVHSPSNLLPSTMNTTLQHGCKIIQENGLLCEPSVSASEPNSGPSSESNKLSSPSPKRIRLEEDDEEDIFAMNDIGSSQAENIILSSPEDFSDDSLLDKKTEAVRYLLTSSSVEPSILSEESANYSDSSEEYSISPTVSSPENAAVRNFGSTEIKLNTEDDYPDGSWLGNENKPEMRVRCSLNPLELAYVNTTCCTPKKMALALVNRLFQFNFQTPSDFLQAQRNDGWTMLDPLLMYGIQCHLISMFGINNEAWKELKWIIDSKCLSILNRHMQATSAMTNFNRNGEPSRVVNRNSRRVGPAQLEFLSRSSKAKVLHIDSNETEECIQTPN